MTKHNAEEDYHDYASSDEDLPYKLSTKQKKKPAKPQNLQIKKHSDHQIIPESSRTDFFNRAQNYYNFNSLIRIDFQKLTYTIDPAKFKIAHTYGTGDLIYYIDDTHIALAKVLSTHIYNTRNPNKLQLIREFNGQWVPIGANLLTQNKHVNSKFANWRTGQQFRATMKGRYTNEAIAAFDSHLILCDWSGIQTLDLSTGKIRKSFSFGTYDNPCIYEQQLVTCFDNSLVISISGHVYMFKFNERTGLLDENYNKICAGSKVVALGRHILVYDNSHKFFIYDPSTGQLLREFPCTIKGVPKVDSIGLVASNMVILNAGGTNWWLMDTDTGRGIPAPMSGTIVSSGAGKIVTVDNKQIMHVWKIKPDLLAKPLPFPRLWLYSCRQLLCDVSIKFVD
jgi:outer membrane protein assembly factor BamB